MGTVTHPEPLDWSVVTARPAPASSFLVVPLSYERGGWSESVVPSLCIESAGIQVPPHPKNFQTLGVQDGTIHLNFIDMGSGWYRHSQISD